MWIKGIHAYGFGGLRFIWRLFAVIFYWFPVYIWACLLFLALDNGEILCICLIL
jgi:hypothetical protein